jgi:hypothetical protein
VRTRISRALQIKASRSRTKVASHRTLARTSNASLNSRDKGPLAQPAATRKPHKTATARSTRTSSVYLGR